jgi:hypothetical protein
MAVSPAPLPGGGVLHRCRSGPHTLPGAGHPPPPHLRPGSLWMAGGIPAHHPPRSPASNIVTGGSGILTRGWHLRLWAPFFVF